MKNKISKERFNRILTAKYRNDVKEIYFSTLSNLWIAVMNDGKRFQDRTQKDLVNSIKFHIDMKEKEKYMNQENKFAFEDEMEEEIPSVENNDAIQENVGEHEVIEPVKITCIKCGNTFVMTPTEIKFYREHGYVMPRRCPQCRVDKNDVTEVTCKDCGRTFTVSAREKDYFVSRGLSIPKRCRQCRQFRKQNQK